MLCSGAEIALSAISTSVSRYLISPRIVFVLAAFVVRNGCSRADSTTEPEAPPESVNVATSDPAGTTAPVALNVYDGTGLPALSLPCGFTRAQPSVAGAPAVISEPMP